MNNQLGTFEGRKVESSALKLSGSVADRIGHLDLEEQVFIIVKGTVAGVLHGDVKDVFTRTHKVSASALVILDPGDGERMLDEAQMIADERFGVENLFRQANDAIGADPETGEISE